MKLALINLFFVVELLFLTTESYSQNNFILAGDSLSKEVNFYDIEDETFIISRLTDSWGKPLDSRCVKQFDLNKDGIYDIQIGGESYYHIVYHSDRLFANGQAGSLISTDNGVKVYNYNERIDENCNWGNGSTLVEYTNYGINCSLWKNVFDKYLAVKMLTQSDTLLGWVKLSVYGYDKAIIKSYAVQKSVKSQIEEIKNEKLFSVFPNPSNNFININIHELVRENYLTILGENGQILNKYTIVNPFTHIDISNLKSGVYFLKMSNNERFEVRKIVKK